MLLCSHALTAFFFLFFFKASEDDVKEIASTDDDGDADEVNKHELRVVCIANLLQHIFITSTT